MIGLISIFLQWESEYPSNVLLKYSGKHYVWASFTFICFFFYGIISLLSDYLNFSEKNKRTIFLYISVISIVFPLILLINIITKDDSNIGFGLIITLVICIALFVNTLRGFRIKNLNPFPSKLFNKMLFGIILLCFLVAVFITCKYFFFNEKGNINTTIHAEKETKKVNSDTANLISLQGSFVKKADFIGTSRSRAISFAINNKGYYGTGNYANNPESSEMYCYNPSTNKWSQIASLPKGMQAGIGFSIGNKGYAGCGWQSGNAFTNFYEYNSITDTWITKANFIGNPINDAVGFSINNLGYIGCGGKPYGNCTNQFYEYNPSTNKWSQKPNFPGSGCRSPFGISFGNYGYIGCGSDGTKSNNTCYKFDQTLNTWNLITNFPVSAETRNSSIAIKGIIYVYCNKNLYSYNPAQDLWSIIKGCPFTTNTDAAFVIDNKGYFIEAGTNKFWEFTPVSIQSENIQLLQIEKTTITSSSNMPPSSGLTYYAKNVSDNNLKTWWSPKTASQQEWIKLDFGTVIEIAGIEIHCGSNYPDYPNYGNLFTLNSRITEAKLEFSDGSTENIDIKDIDEIQNIIFTVHKTSYVKLYPKGWKNGSKWNDLCISHFMVLEQLVNSVSKNK